MAPKQELGMRARFEAAYISRFRTTVHALQRRRVPDAEEYAQAAWVLAWERRESIRCESPAAIAAWVITTGWRMFLHRQDSKFVPLEASLTDVPTMSKTEARIDACKVLMMTTERRRRALWSQACRIPLDGSGRKSAHDGCAEIRRKLRAA